MAGGAGEVGVGASRVLAWHGRAVLGRHRFLVLATVGRDGVPHLAQVAYRLDGDELYLGVAHDSPVAADLGAVGPVAGLIAGADGVPLLQLSGAAEALAEPGDQRRVGGLFGEAPAARALYRVSPDEYRPRAGTLEARAMAAGETIVRQGEVADRFYVILAGECDVLRHGGAGEQTIARLGPGEFFGESGLLAGVPRNASVVATAGGELVALSRTTFASALNDIAPTASDLARVLFTVAQGR